MPARTAGYKIWCVSGRAGNVPVFGVKAASSLHHLAPLAILVLHKPARQRRRAITLTLVGMS